jgi:hypothetical protein
MWQASGLHGTLARDWPSRMVRAVDAEHMVRYVLQLGAVLPATPMMQPRAFTSSMLPRTLVVHGVEVISRWRARGWEKPVA